MIALRRSRTLICTAAAIFFAGSAYMSPAHASAPPEPPPALVVIASLDQAPATIVDAAGLEPRYRWIRGRALSGLTNGTAYTFQITADDIAGPGAPASITATPGPTS
jgi:hypothetical protein